MISALSLMASGWHDPRDIRNGVPMLAAGYTDQPYCAVSPNDRWVCVITASMGGEGSAGEEVYSVTSDDHGASWSAPVVVENGTATPGGLPNAYANIILAPKLNGGKGRFYTVFNLNRDNVSMSGRGDELGFFYMRYSDDAGGSWSKDRHLVPYPNTWVDRQNDFKGKTHIMWTVDHVKVLADGSTAAFAFTKIGRYVQNPPEEVFFMASPNLLSEPDAAAVRWTLLPAASDHGVRAPAMYDPNTTVMEEGHLLPARRLRGDGAHRQGVPRRRQDQRQHRGRWVGAHGAGEVLGPAPRRRRARGARRHSSGGGQHDVSDGAQERAGAVHTEAPPSDPGCSSFTTRWPAGTRTF